MLVSLQVWSSYLLVVAMALLMQVLEVRQFDLASYWSDEKFAPSATAYRVSLRVTMDDSLWAMLSMV